MRSSRAFITSSALLRISGSQRSTNPPYRATKCKGGTLHLRQIQDLRQLQEALSDAFVEVRREGKPELCGGDVLALVGVRNGAVRDSTSRSIIKEPMTGIWTLTFPAWTLFLVKRFFPPLCGRRGGRTSAPRQVRVGNICDPAGSSGP